MVTLSKIYTRTGDDGETMLGDGSRVKKTSARVRSYGACDELNSMLGLVLLHVEDNDVRDQIQRLQNDLFDLGSDLCTPFSEAEESGQERRANRFPAKRTQRLEQWIDAYQKQLEPLKSFVLPGGSVASTWIHQARTICRRAEIEILALKESGQSVNKDALTFINRLSDYFFVLARWCNRETGEVLWQPGGAD